MGPKKGRLPSSPHFVGSVSGLGPASIWVRHSTINYSNHQHHHQQEIDKHKLREDFDSSKCENTRPGKVVKAKKDPEAEKGLTERPSSYLLANQGCPK